MKLKSGITRVIGTHASLNKTVKFFFISILIAVVFYYLWSRGFIYLQFSKDVYTEYFWPRAIWLFIHVVLGIVATLIGPFQFLSSLRKKHPGIHRKLGKLYISSVFVSTFISFYLVYTSGLGLVYAAGLATLGIAWISVTGLAWLSILKGNIELHRRSMLKSYILTLAFVCNRWVEDILAVVGIGDFFERKTLMAWACWAIPLLVTEVVLHIKSLYFDKK